jgi:hypothetical protein
MATKVKMGKDDPILSKLSEIHSVLQDLLILEGARAGISKAKVREIVGVGADRVTRIWKNLGSPESR